MEKSVQKVFRQAKTAMYVWLGLKQYLHATDADIKFAHGTVIIDGRFKVMRSRLGLSWSIFEAQGGSWRPSTQDTLTGYLSGL